MVIAGVAWPPSFFLSSVGFDSADSACSVSPLYLCPHLLQTSKYPFFGTGERIQGKVAQARRCPREEVMELDMSS